jgi:DNA-binding NarL/FixJ family response regulator
MRTLIAEDEVNLSEVLRRYLEPVSSCICVVSTIKELKEAVNQFQFDLITYDLRYPDSPVKEESLLLIRDIKKQQPEAIIIIVTGYYEPSLERYLTESEADGIIKKGEATRSPDNFIRAIREIVDAIQLHPSHITRINTLEKASCRLAEYYRAHALA